MLLEQETRGSERKGFIIHSESSSHSTMSFGFLSPRYPWMGPLRPKDKHQTGDPSVLEQVTSQLALYLGGAGATSFWEVAHANASLRNGPGKDQPGP